MRLKHYPECQGTLFSLFIQFTSTVPVLLISKQAKQCPVVLNEAETLPRMPGDTVQFVYTIHKYSPTLVKIFTRSRRDLAAISARIAARSRRVFGRRDFPISPRSRPRSRRDHVEIREISAAKYSPRSRRDLAAISPRFSPRCGKSRRPKTRRDLPRFSPRSQRDMEISAGKYAARSRRDTEISAAKTRRDREVISRRDMDISAGSFAARPRWESCRDLRRETKFLAVKILLLSRREAKFSAAKLGSMRTIFTLTLTVNQTTRR